MAGESKTAVIAAFIGNCLIAIAKYIGAFITGSSAMLSEAVHSTADTGNQLLLMLGLKRSKKEPTQQHPFGYGKEVYFWSFAVAILLFGIGAGISIYEGIHSLFHPSPVQDVLVSYIILGLAIIFEGSSWTVAFKQFRKSKPLPGYMQSIRKGKDPTIFVVLFEDTAAIFGLIVALLGIWLSELTGILIFDGIASLIIGVILAVTATWLAYETKSLLIGESASPEVEEGIQKITAGYSEIKTVNDIFTLHMGPEHILLTATVNFKDDLKADQVEKTVEQITREVRKEYPLVKKVFIEAEENSNE